MSRNTHPAPGVPKRGEIWRARLDPVQGSEQAKTHLVVVLSVPRVWLPSMRLCAPMMDFQGAHIEMRWCDPVAPSPENGLAKLSTADAMQVRALDTVRFGDRIGRLEAVHVEALAAALALCIGVTFSSNSSKISKSGTGKSKAT